MSNVDDYKNSVFLPKTDFPLRGELSGKEPGLLAYWQKIDLFSRLRTQSMGKPKFILHDGPPFANGHMHLGHALNHILKDVVARTHQMIGFDAPYVPGWDCHGLPIEWKVEEQYRSKGTDKDLVPPAQFRKECRSFAQYWKDIQSEEIQRLGILGDFAHPYLTMSYHAEAQIVREIHKFLQRGLLYKGARPIMWSVVEKTALAEAEIEYHDHKSTTLWIRFPIVSSPISALVGAGVVIWTTTPWTIPANRAIAFGNFSYAHFQVDAVDEDSVLKPGDRLLVALDILESFCSDAKIAKKTILNTILPDMLEGILCSHPLRQRNECDGYFDYNVPLYQGSFVTTEAGTGFVHIAPGHGEEDFNLGRQFNIPFEESVSDDGRYLPNIKGFAGLYVYTPDGKPGEANVAVIRALSQAGALIFKRNITHSYPHSWRSKAPLIFRTTPQWFIALDGVKVGETGESLRSLALKNIDMVKWYPTAGSNRIHSMIENRPDWCISRQRLWGVPIALFVSKEDHKPLKDPEVLERIAATFEKEGADAWYTHTAQEFLGATYKSEDYDQVFDIVDVWFESGSTHSFVLDQALPNPEWPNLAWPADLYLEGSDQHRGWFHSSLLEACGTREKAPYRTVLTHGFVLDEQGRKQSKSLGNVVDPNKVIQDVGADILRLWVVSSDYSQDLSLGPNILKQTSDVYRRLRNTLRYLLGALHGMSETEQIAQKDMPELERWMLSQINEMDHSIRRDITTYDYNTLLQRLHNFCTNDLSAFYFDVRKDSLYCDAYETSRRRATRTVMEIILNHLTVWLAPILCFTAEEAYQANPRKTTESVHLLTFPETPDTWADAMLDERWKDIRAIRRVVTGALEIARANKLITSSLQASVKIYAPADKISLLQSIDFSEICIVSDVCFSDGVPSAKSYTLPDAASIGVEVSPAPGHKCERCWRVYPQLTQKGICPRCEEVILGKRQQ